VSRVVACDNSDCDRIYYCRHPCSSMCVAAAHCVGVWHLGRVAALASTVGGLRGHHLTSQATPPSWHTAMTILGVATSSPALPLQRTNHRPIQSVVLGRDRTKAEKAATMFTPAGVRQPLWWDHSCGEADGKSSRCPSHLGLPPPLKRASHSCTQPGPATARPITLLSRPLGWAATWKHSRMLILPD
jgi:hypothetical protein